MAGRTVIDRLREEYFTLLPEMRRVAEHLEAEVRYHLAPIVRRLDTYEHVVVKARVKDCESAISKVEREQEGAVFNDDKPELYSLLHLRDLAAIRVLVFPRSRLAEVDSALNARFRDWQADRDFADKHKLALKYSGYCQSGDRIPAEYQIVPILTGLFWEVEHSAIYKATPELRGVMSSPQMKQRSTSVLNALQAFEDEFERIIREEGSNQRA